MTRETRSTIPAGPLISAYAVIGGVGELPPPLVDQARQLVDELSRESDVA